MLSLLTASCSASSIPCPTFHSQVAMYCRYKSRHSTATTTGAGWIGLDYLLALPHAQVPHHIPYKRQLATFPHPHMLYLCGFIISISTIGHYSRGIQFTNYLMTRYVYYNLAHPTGMTSMHVLSDSGSSNYTLDQVIYK